MNPQPDNELLKQVDHVLDQATTGDQAVVNHLAHTQPRIDSGFQNTLEERLLAKLKAQHAQPVAAHFHSDTQEEPKVMHTVTAAYVLPHVMLKRQTEARSFSYLTWAAAAVAVILIGGLMFGLSNGGRPPALSGTSSTAVAQTLETVQLVIATQDIIAGTVITDDLVGVVSLSAADMAELRISQPGREFFSDVAQVIGQPAAVDIFWFSPIDSLSLGEPVDLCDLPGAYCPEVPEGYSTIGLPTDAGLLADVIQGLKIGDRVDVLAIAGGQIKVIVKNVLLADIQDNMVILAAPTWQHLILIGLYRTGEPYALRLYTGAAAAADMTPVEYTFTSPEPLPQDYTFDLIVGLPDSKGYQMVDLPAPFNHIQATAMDTLLQFWFKDIKVMGIENETTVTIQLPKADAENLDYLISIGAKLTFVPDGG
jgi:hypothetical protein